MSKSAAQLYYGLLAAVVLLGVTVNGIVAWQDTEAVGRFSPGFFRLLNTFAFFTIQSNLLVGVTSFLLCLDLVRTGSFFRYCRLLGLVGITITGVVYHWLLSEDHNPTGLADFGNVIVHYLVPIMAVAGFLLFGPRGMLTVRLVLLTPLYLVAWGGFTLIRGELTDPAWYPYPFIDVAAKGWGRVIANGIGIAAMYLAVGFLYLAIDRALSARKD